MRVSEQLYLPPAYNTALVSLSVLRGDVCWNIFPIKMKISCLLWLCEVCLMTLVAEGSSVPGKSAGMKTETRKRLVGRFGRSAYAAEE